MTSPFSPAAFRLTDLLQDAASRAVAVDPRDLNSPRGNLALLGEMNYRRQADGRYEAQPQVDALGVTEARASAAYMLEEWNGNHAAPAGRLVSFGPNQLRAGRRGVVRETAAVTNKVPNPRGLGARIGTVTGGSPTGALPTGWVINAQGGVTWTVVDYALVNGVERVTLRFNGTATGSIILAFMDQAEIAWGTASQNTVAFNARLVAGSLTNMSTPRIDCVERNSDGSAASLAFAELSVFDAVDRRYFVTLARTGGTGQFVQNRLTFNTPSGAVDCTVEISLPQAEDGALASHPVVTPAGADPAASTKAASTFTPSTAVNTRSTRKWGIDWDFSHGGRVQSLREMRALNSSANDNGLLIEEGSTNLLRNPRGEGTTLPTHWNEAQTADMTRTWARGEDEFGPYVQLTMSGTPSATRNYQLRFEALATTVVATGQPLTLSCGVRLMSGSMTGVSPQQLRVVEEATNNIVPASIAVGAAHRRWFVTIPSVAGSTTTVRCELLLQMASGVPINYTIRIYQPQLEQKAFPTSPILPPAGTLASSTRGGDGIAIENAGIVENQPFSVFVEQFCPSPLVAGQNLRSVAIGQNNANAARLFVGPTGQVNLQLIQGGSTIFSLQSADGLVTPGSLVRCAYVINPGGHKLFINGALVASSSVSTALNVGTGQRAGLGGDPTRSFVLGVQQIRQAVYYPQVLTDAQAIALTRP